MFTRVIDLERRITYPVTMPQSSKIFSMTGFSRSAGAFGKYSWNWEAKSVNGKGLDIRCRLPLGFEDLDIKVRNITTQILGRGNISLNLAIKESGEPPKFKVNRELLKELIETAKELMGDIAVIGSFRPENFFGVKGVIEPVEEKTNESQIQKRNELILTDLEKALADLSLVRQVEGKKIFKILESQLTDIEDLIKRAEGLEELQPQTVRERLKKQIDELINTSSGLSEERFAQEAAMLMVKMDVREELDRLGVHTSAARQLLIDGRVIGRKLEFLCQELNREVNTICSKANNIKLSNIGLNLKSVIEQFREQVQNIE